MMPEERAARIKVLLAKITVKFLKTGWGAGGIMMGLRKSLTDGQKNG